VDVNILDFSKAFDVVSHRKLLAKLHHYGIQGNILGWIQSFLSSRSQSVVVDGVTSKPAPVLSGVPQRTCLGPILFLIYINDITVGIKSQLRLFADDALLYRPIHSMEDHFILQEDLAKLEQWAENWDMKFNPSKCYTMSIKNRGEKSSHFYSLCNQFLKAVSHNPYLGVLLSDNLTFASHINNVCAKSARMLGFLGRNLRSCPTKLRELAYVSMCRSTLEYASQIWDPHLRSECDRLEKIQRRAARFVVQDKTIAVQQVSPPS
jgi:ribonuclease P/MRP protein subunit RPP40